MFQNFVRFKKELAVDAFKVPKVMRLELAPMAALDQRGRFGFLVIHTSNIQPDIPLTTHPPLDKLGVMAKPVLGRGLGALLSGASAALKPSSILSAQPESSASAAVFPAANDDGNQSVLRIGLQDVRPCPHQPRKEFSETALRELADSIREQGIVQPLIVRARDSHYELIAGERRWRAAQMLGLADVPVLVREADDRTVLELALIENLQRENLNPLEEALGFSQLIEQFQLTQEEAALKVGKSRAAVANALRLLKLPQEVQQTIRAGTLSVGHAKVILGLPEPENQKKAAQRVLAQSLNVRQTEELVAQWQKLSTAPDPKPPSSPVRSTRDTHVADLEDRLQQRLGTKVTLRYREGKGAMEIRFFSDAELDRLLQLLGLPAE
jgi:ParB family transcriptional regulator, chromosome partitioning protein